MREKCGSNGSLQSFRIAETGGWLTGGASWILFDSRCWHGKTDATMELDVWRILLSSRDGPPAAGDDHDHHGKIRERRFQALGAGRDPGGDGRSGLGSFEPRTSCGKTPLCQGVRVYQI